MNTQRIGLDLAKRSGNQQVVIAQGDAAGTTIEATVYDNGTRLAEAGIEAFFMMELPDREHYVRDGATYSNGVVTYVVDESHAAAVEGYTDNAYFELHKGATIASTERFAVIVRPSAYSDKVPAEDWDDAIVALVEAAAQAIADAQAAMRDAASAARGASAAADDARAAATATAGVVSQAVAALSLETGGEAAQIRALAVELANLKGGYVVAGEALYAPSSKVTVSGEAATPSAAAVSAERVTLS